MSILASGTRFVTTTFTFGTATTAAAAAGAEILQDYAEYYRDENRTALAARRIKSEMIAVAKAQNKVTEVMLDIDERLNDPKFAAMHAKVCAAWNSKDRAILSVTPIAAE